MFEAANNKEHVPYPCKTHIKNPRSSREDLHAMLLLAELDPSERDIISCGEHDQVWFGVEPEWLSKLLHLSRFKNWFGVESCMTKITKVSQCLYKEHAHD